MNYLPIKQLSNEWFDLKVGKVSGTRFGQLISGRKNRLKYDLINEKLDGYILQDDWTSEDMLFGLHNEALALDEYERQYDVKITRGGVILSDFSKIHMASPDGVGGGDIVYEVKCTMNGAIHIQRFIEGVETAHIPQIINYFAVSDSIKRVMWMSYCPMRTEKPLVIWEFSLDTILDAKKGTTVRDAVKAGRLALSLLNDELDKIEKSFIF